MSSGVVRSHQPCHHHFARTQNKSESILREILFEKLRNPLDFGGGLAASAAVSRNKYYVGIFRQILVHRHLTLIKGNKCQEFICQKMPLV